MLCVFTREANTVRQSVARGASSVACICLRILNPEKAEDDGGFGCKGVPTWNEMGEITHDGAVGWPRIRVRLPAAE